MKNKLHAYLLTTFIAIVLWSAIHPFDPFTWWLEALPALVALPILAFTYRRFTLSNLAYVLITLHALILLVGAHYTYAEVPLFNSIRDWLGTTRNSYDGVGHFAQGFIPAIIMRELLLRTSPLPRGKWMITLIILSCLGISGAYELLEAIVSISVGGEADAFLGTQGDIWDTQKDMALAAIGAACALAFLSRPHDLSLVKLANRQ